MNQAQILLNRVANRNTKLAGNVAVAVIVLRAVKRNVSVKSDSTVICDITDIRDVYSAFTESVEAADLTSIPVYINNIKHSLSTLIERGVESTYSCVFFINAEDYDRVAAYTLVALNINRNLLKSNTVAVLSICLIHSRSLNHVSISRSNGS